MLRIASIQSFSRARSAASLAAVTFALGLLGGGAIGTLMAGRHIALATAAPSPPAPPRLEVISSAVHPAEVLRVIDGDTFEARVHVWPGLDITTKVRLRGIDAPELKAHCPEEREKAEAAREALRAILAEGGMGVLRVSLDKYGGRVVADAATRSTPNVSAALLAKGLARPYGGGRREGWCGPGAAE